MVRLNRLPRYPSGEEGDNFLVQMISTCLPSRRGRGVVGVGTLWVGVVELGRENYAKIIFVVRKVVTFKKLKMDFCKMSIFKKNSADEYCFGYFPIFFYFANFVCVSNSRPMVAKKSSRDVLHLPEYLMLFIRAFLRFLPLSEEKIFLRVF
jgi:hypothetical protein